MHQFDQDIAITAKKSSVFEASVSPNWSINGIPNGGYLLALLTNAMRQLSANERIVVVTANYLSRLKPGPVELAVEQFSASSRLDRFECRLFQFGKERVRAIGTFAKEDETSTDKRCEKDPPDLAPLDKCVTVPVMPKYTLFEQVEARLDPPSAGWFEGKLSPRSEMKGWIRFKDGRPFDALSVLLMADAFPPPLLASHGMVGWIPTVELSVSMFNPPRSSWLKCCFHTDFLHQGYCQEDGEVWDENGALVAVSRQVANFRRMA